MKFVEVILTPSMSSSSVKEKFNNCYFLFSPVVNMFIMSHLGINYIEPILNIHELPTANVSCNNLSLAIVTSLPLPYLCQF